MDERSTLPRWCRACGADPPAAGPDCPACGTALDPPAFGPARVGRAVLRGSRLLSRTVVAVAETGDTVLVLDRDDQPVPLAAADFDRMPPVPLPANRCRGAVGRLWTAESARYAGTLKARWPASAAGAAATRLAVADLAARRGAAVDLALLGLPDRPELGLPEAETTWYRACAAALGGDLADLLDHWGRLPPTGYPARVDLLLARFADLRADPAAATTVAALLAPWRSRSIDARALVAALTPAGGSEALEMLDDYARTAGCGRRTAAAIGGPHPLPATATGGAVRILGAYLDAEAGRAPVPVDVLAVLAVPLLDRLVSAGAVTGVPPEAGLPPRSAAFLRCRLNLERADDDTVAAAGFVAERARRAYLHGDDRVLADLPDADEAVRHYRALRAYVATGELRDDDLRAGAREVVKLTDEIAMPFPVARPVPEQVAMDPTAWPRLWRNAIAGKLTLDDRVRERCPQFAYWFDMCRMHVLLQVGRWGEVTRCGRTAVAGAADPRTRAAALNAIAYAEWQMGRHDRADRLLTEALNLRAVAGLAVNAALVNAARGFLAELPCLARTMQLAADEQLRRAALRRALELWGAHGRAPDPPATLTAMLRGELLRPQPDDEWHHELLALAARHDSAWLAETAVATTGPLQVRCARYHRSRAAVAERRSTSTLREAAIGLAALWRVPARPPWLTAERSWLLGVLVEVLQQDYDEAVNPAPAIEALARAEVVDDIWRIRMTVWAGAHLALAFQQRRQELAPEAEERLLFAPVAAYWRKQDGWDATATAALADFLAVQVANATVAAVNNAVMFWNDYPRRYRELARRSALTWEDNRANMAARAKLVGLIEQHVQHCQRYLRLMAGLPVDDKLRDQVRELIVSMSKQIPYLRRY